MDGPIRLGQRELAIEFRSDRHGEDRVEMAYRRVEMLAAADSPRKSSAQTTLPAARAIATFASEIQG